MRDFLVWCNIVNIVNIVNIAPMTHIGQDRVKMESEIFHSSIGIRKQIDRTVGSVIWGKNIITTFFKCFYPIKYDCLCVIRNCVPTNVVKQLTSNKNVKNVYLAGCLPVPLLTDSSFWLGSKKQDKNNGHDYITTCLICCNHIWR